MHDAKCYVCGELLRYNFNEGICKDTGYEEEIYDCCLCIFQPTYDVAEKIKEKGKKGCFEFHSYFIRNVCGRVYSKK